MVRSIACLSLVAAAGLLPGCASDKPELTDREREIIDRRKMYGEETPITRERSDGSWHYDSEDGEWTLYP